MRTSRSSMTLTLGTMAWCDTPSSALSQKCPDLPRRMTGRPILRCSAEVCRFAPFGLMRCSKTASFRLLGRRTFRRREQAEPGAAVQPRACGEHEMKKDSNAPEFRCRSGSPHARGGSLRSSGFRQPRQADKLGTIPERVIAPRDCRQRNHIIVAEGLQMRLTAQKLREACDRD